MDNIVDLIQMFSKSNEEKKVEIPKEVADQYPYGQFPIRYTKVGQEEIRKQSESRFSYTEENKDFSNNSNGLDLKSLLPIIQLMSSGKKNSKDMMAIISKLLFKDNPTYEKLFSQLTKIKSQEIKREDDFPDTNNIKISSLKRI